MTRAKSSPPRPTAEQSVPSLPEDAVDEHSGGAFIHPSVVEDELESLATVLGFLIDRDDERPATWTTQSFVQQVATIRSRLSSIISARRFVARHRLMPRVGSVGEAAFEAAARELGRDPARVAVAIRWLEIRAGVRLPAWPQLLSRGATLMSERRSRTNPDAALWFG